LAINLSFAAGASSGPSAKATRFYKKLRRRSKSPARLRLIVRPCAGVNACEDPSRDTFGPDRVVAGDYRGTIRRREGRQGRSDACETGVPVDVSEQRLYTGDQRLPVE
jgi:hypothetical protein